MSRHLSAKAFILSIFSIFLIGLIFIFGIYFMVNSGNTPSKPATIFSGPVTAAKENLDLNLSNPDDNSLVFSSNLLVQGEALPHGLVIISWNDNTQTITAGDDGAFSSTIKLQSGVNDLIVAAFDNQGNSKQEKRTIYYSTEKL